MAQACPAQWALIRVPFTCFQKPFEGLKKKDSSPQVELPSSEIRHVLTGIVGQEDGLGVENLSGSGLIAGAYARAYQETFTLTYVTGRTVGIGAYLARLGQRCIQRLDQPIILTG